MKKITYILTAIIAFISVFSCTDESTFNNPTIHDLAKGGFVRFANTEPKALVFDAQDIVYAGEIIDANNNLSSYTISLKAAISGKNYFIDDYVTITSFPATLTITSQQLADAIGIEVNDFSLGSLFSFVGIATTNDGRVFNGERPEFDANTGAVGVGNTEANLELASYKNAMTFSILIACPPSPAGIYRIDMHDTFADGWQTDNPDGGSGIQITVDDEIIEFGMCSPYTGSNTGSFLDESRGLCTPGDGIDATTTIEIPAGAELVLWEFPGDQYGEISFEIYDPNGVLIGEYGTDTPAGVLVLCDDDLTT